MAPLGELAGPCAERLEAGLPSPMLDLWAWDLCDVPQPDRVRARVHLRGRVRQVHVVGPLQRYWADEPVACFSPEIITLSVVRAGGSRTDMQVVALPEFQAARPDPLAGWERSWIRHLSEHHSDELGRLTERHMSLVQSDVVRPWRATRSGIAVRVYRANVTNSIPLPFPWQVNCGCEANRAFEQLVGELPRPTTNAGPPHRSGAGES